MSEQPTPEEFAKPTHPILDLAKELNTPITLEIELLMDHMHPGMEVQEKRNLFTLLHTLLEQKDLESDENDTSSQIKRQIGVVLVTAHMMRRTRESWELIGAELEDALTMADQTADTGLIEFTAIGNAINNLIIDLEPKQS